MGTTSVFRTVDNLGRILTRVKTQSPLKRDMVSFTRLNVSAEICERDEKKIDNREKLICCIRQICSCRARMA